MRSVTINRRKLLDVVKANREIHVNDYKEALVGYRKAAIEELENNWLDAKAGKAIKHNITAIIPHSYEDSYNTVISMLEFSTDDTVELTMQEFQQYVEDKWDWKHLFNASTAIYNGAK